MNQERRLDSGNDDFEKMTPLERKYWLYERTGQLIDDAIGLYGAMLSLSASDQQLQSAAETVSKAIQILDEIDESLTGGREKANEIGSWDKSR